MSERGTSSELLCVGSADGCVSISLNDSWTGKKLLDSIDHDYNLHMSPEEFQVRNTFIRTFALPFNVESHESIRNADADQLKSDFQKLKQNKKEIESEKETSFLELSYEIVFYFFRASHFAYTCFIHATSTIKQTSQMNPNDIYIYKNLTSKIH